jgi:hypothetical protein
MASIVRVTSDRDPAATTLILSQRRRMFQSRRSGRLQYASVQSWVLARGRASVLPRPSIRTPP